MLYKITQIRRTRAGSNRLTCNVIRNQQRNRKTLNEANIASLKAMDYYFAPISWVCPSRAGTGREGKASLESLKKG